MAWVEPVKGAGRRGALVLFIVLGVVAGLLVLCLFLASSVLLIFLCPLDIPIWVLTGKRFFSRGLQWLTETIEGKRW